MKFEMELKIVGTSVLLSLINPSGSQILQANWEDKRNLSDKLLEKIVFILKKEGISFKNIRKINFYCDSPYFAKNEKWEDMKMENFEFTGKCGFTTWQTGEIFSKVINFALDK